MFRYLIYYHNARVYKEHGCCTKPFTKPCGECKHICLCTTTAEAEGQEAALTQVKAFCSEGVEFTAEPIVKNEPQVAPKVNDKRWPMLRKDD